MDRRKAYSQILVEVYDQRHFGGPSGWHVFEKDRQALQALLLPPPARVLDIPCGTGIYSAALRDQGYEVIAADASLPMLETTGKRGLDLFRTLGDINRLPLGKDSVDAAIVLRLFSHFPRKEIAHMLVELRRVIRPSGRIIFDTFRWSPRYWPGLDRILDKSHIYPIRDRQVEALIRKAGLRKVEMRATYLFSPIWQRKLPLWMLERLSALEQLLPQEWLLRPFWACTKDEDGTLRRFGVSR